MTVQATTASTVPTVQLDTDFDTQGLTGEALLMYLQTRLEGLDSQIEARFAKQQKIEQMRKALNKMQTTLSNQNDDTTNKDTIETDGAWVTELNDALDAIEQVDPQYAQQLRGDLQQTGQALVGDGSYTTEEIKNSTDYINTCIKSLESESQLEMIQLQSLMSARQTAIQMATNLVSAFNESSKAIAGNVGR